MAEPRFSIVLPLYNKRDTIAGTIRAILAQTFCEFEMIVVDDGSRDDSFEVVAGFSDARIKLVWQQNGGPGSARNRGMGIARGEYLAFCDGDDLWFPDHLEELDRIARARPQAGLIGSAFVEATAGLGLPDIERGASSVIDVDYVRVIGGGGNPFWTSSAAIRRTVFETMGGMCNLSYGEDREYWVRIALAHPVAASKRVTAVYVRDTGGLMDSGSTRWLGRTLSRPGDVSPVIATALSALESSDGGKLRLDLERLVDRYLGYAIEASVVIGDVRTLRSVRNFFFGRPGFRQWLFLQVARLPTPIAAFVLRRGYAAKATIIQRARTLVGV